MWGTFVVAVTAPLVVTGVLQAARGTKSWLFSPEPQWMKRDRRVLERRRRGVELGDELRARGLFNEAFWAHFAANNKAAEQLVFHRIRSGRFRYRVIIPALLVVTVMLWCTLATLTPALGRGGVTLAWCAVAFSLLLVLLWAYLLVRRLWTEVDDAVKKHQLWQGRPEDQAHRPRPDRAA